MRLAFFVLLAIAGVSMASRAGAVDIQEITTPLGIKAWLVQDKSAPLVALSFSFAGGTASELASRKGVTNLMALLLTDGAGPMPADVFTRRQEDAAVSLGFGASTDRLAGSLRVLTASRDQGFGLLRLAMTEPRFDTDMVEQRRAEAIAELEEAAQRPQAVANRTMMATMFADHPYSLNTQGMRETLTTLTPVDLRSRASALVVRTGLIVAAVGDIDAAELSLQLDRTFGDLPVGEPLPALPDWTPPSRPHTIVVDRPVPQSSVVMAMPGVVRDDPDWYAALVMAHILVGDQQSRLFNEVREKRGLAYSVSGGLHNSAKASLFTIATGSANDRVAETVRVIRGELARLRTGGVTGQELDDAKTYLSGALALSLDSSSAIAGLLHNLQVDGLPRDYLDKRAGLIGAVTAEDVHRVARRVLRDDAITTIVVGKPVGLVAD